MMAAELSLPVAARWLGAVYGALISERGQLGQGSLPAWMTPTRRRPLRFALTSQIDVAIARAIYPDAARGYARADDAMVLRREVYERSLRTFLDACEPALRRVTNDALSRQGQELQRLSMRFAAPGIEEQIHESAKRIWAGLREALPGGVHGLSPNEPTAETQSAPADTEILPGGVKEPSGPQKARDRQDAPPADFANRHRLLAAIRIERDALESGTAAPFAQNRLAIEVSKLLAAVAVHPQAAEMLRLYLASPPKGTSRIRSEISRAIAATAELLERLTAPETRDDAWGYAPLVVRAVIELRLEDVPGLPEFAVAMGRLLEMTKTTLLIGGASVLVILLSIAFTGPLGAAVVATLDLALAGTHLGITLLQMHEQAIAASASDFDDEDNKLAAHPDGVDSALGVAAAFLSAVFLARAARRLLETRPRSPDTLKSGSHSKAPPPKTPNSQGVANRGLNSAAMSMEELHAAQLADVEINNARLSAAELHEASVTFSRVKQEVAEAAKGQVDLTGFYVPASIDDLVSCKAIGTIYGRPFQGTGGAYPNVSLKLVVIGKEAAQGIAIRGLSHSLRTIVRHEVGEVLEMSGKALWPEFGSIANSHWRSSARGALLPGTMPAEQILLLKDAQLLGMPEQVGRQLSETLKISDLYPTLGTTSTTGRAIEDVSRGIRLVQEDRDKGGPRRLRDTGRDPKPAGTDAGTGD